MNIKQLVAALVAFQCITAGAVSVSAEGSSADIQDNVTVFTGSEEDAMSISGENTVPNLKEGESVFIEGIVISDKSLLTSITVEICNSTTGEAVTSKTVSPYSNSYNLRVLDQYIDFSTLKAGDYYYRVLTSNEVYSNYSLVNQAFTVSPSNHGGSTQINEDGFIISDSLIVPDYKEGGAYSVRGILSSESSKITSVTVGIYDINGDMLSGTTFTPNATSCDLSVFDEYVDFSSLKAGSYYYRVIATNGSNLNSAVVNQSFRVTGNSVVPSDNPVQNTSDRIGFSGGRTIPDYKIGTSFSVSGTVSSENSVLSSVTAGVFNESGTMITGKTATPNKTMFFIEDIDDYIVFGQVPAGTYYYKIYATNAKNENSVLVNQKFTVTDTNQNTAPVSDDISVANNISVPNLKVGSFYTVKGIVSSDSSAITTLTAGIYNELGILCSGRTVNPDSKSYDVGALDEFIDFSILKPGDYYYRIVASNSSNTNAIVTNQKFTVIDPDSPVAGSEDRLSISGGVNVPTLKVGEIFSVKGIVSSESSNISYITAGIYDENGLFVNGKSDTPKSKTYDIAKLDNYIEFSALAPGKYYYKIYATNETNTSAALVSQPFTVTSASGNISNPDVPTVSDKITIKNGSVIPDLKQGSAYSINGTLSSEMSKILSVSVAVYDSSNSPVITKTVNPGARTFDIKSVDNDIDFGSLAPGKYTYRVIASNGSNTNDFVVNQPFSIFAKTQTNTTTPSEPASTDNLTIVGENNIPVTLIRGNYLSVYGTVKSASSKITSVTAGVYNSKAVLITGATVTPDATSYNLGLIDEKIKFDQLPPGSYRYAVFASNETNSGVLLTHTTFTVK